jgi:hypothetical protein
MCSNGGSRQLSTEDIAAADIAAAVAKATDELAAALSAGDDAASQGIAAQLAGAWAMITAADPELAARMDRYSPS